MPLAPHHRLAAAPPWHSPRHGPRPSPRPGPIRPPNAGPRRFSPPPTRDPRNGGWRQQKGRVFTVHAVVHIVSSDQFHSRLPPPQVTHGPLPCPGHVPWASIVPLCIGRCCASQLRRPARIHPPPLPRQAPHGVGPTPLPLVCRRCLAWPCRPSLHPPCLRRQEECLRRLRIRGSGAAVCVCPTALSAAPWLPLAVRRVAASHGVVWLHGSWLQACLWMAARARESNRWTAIGPRACCRGLSS